MERVEGRKLPWPELALIACGLIIILVVTFQSATPSCHQWKQRLGNVSAAYLGAAGTDEHPQSRHLADNDHADLGRAARRVLDERPFACL